MNNCKVPGCERCPERRGFCRAHYAQLLRARDAGEPIAFTVLRTPPGQGGRLVVRPTLELLEKWKAAAKKQGLSIQEWVIAACIRASKS